MLVIDVNDIDMEFAASSDKDADVEEQLESESDNSERKRARALIANEKYGGAVYFEDEGPNLDIDKEEED